MAHKKDAEHTGRKLPVSSKVDAWIIDGLDELAGRIRPQPTRSQMVEIALEDFLRAKGIKAKSK